jgi:hypothetical protein
LAYRYLPWKYAVTYLGIWLAYYAVASFRNGNMFDVIRGALATPGFLRGVQRKALDGEALAYLRKFGGRLWY